MRKLVVHAGQHKTGTSAIQMFWLENRDVLLQLGYLYPKSGMNRNGNHKGLIQSILNEPCRALFEHAKTDLIAELEKNPDATVVVSAEYLERFLVSEGRRKQIMSSFKTLASHIQIVVYIRPELEKINSAFVQGVKSFKNHTSFKDFALSRASQIGENYRQFSQVADPPQVAARFLPYNDDVRRSGVVKHFLETIGLSSQEIASCKPERRVNESVGPIAVAAANETLAQLMASGPAPSDRQRAELKKALVNLIAKELPEQPFQGMHTEIIQEIASRGFQHQEDFAQTTWGKSWNEIFSGNDLQKCNAFQLSTSDLETAERYYRMKDALWAAAEVVMAD